MWNDLKELYANERRYDEAGPTSEERLRERQGLMTKEILIRICGRLDCEMSKDSDFRSPYYKEMFDYLNHFGKEIFAYLEDGEFPIHNNLAERTIRKFSETMLYIMEAMVERKWQPCMIV